MPQLIVTVCSSHRRQYLRRLDVRAETFTFAARYLLVWAFQCNKRTLQAIISPSPSLLHATNAQGHAFGLQFGLKHRQMLLTRSSLCVTLAVKWLCYRSARAVTHPMRRIVCALSRLYYLLVRLGEVAVAGGQVHRAVHVAVQRKRGVGRQRFCCTLSQGFAVRDGKQQLLIVRSSGCGSR